MATLETTRVVRRPNSIKGDNMQVEERGLRADPQESTFYRF